MNPALKFLIGLVALFGGGALTVWFIWRTVKKADDPGSMTVKWVATAIISGILVWLGMQAGRADYGSAFIIAGAGAGLGVALGILWAPHLGTMLAKPFTSFYDGGEQEVEARPFYAIARAKQKRGHYQEALNLIRAQLERFPEDFEGWMMMGEIYARDLKDNAGAQSCMAEILRHESHAPKNMAYALTCSAEWHLTLNADREAARQSFEQIVNLFPDSDLAHTAAQRIAHLTPEVVLAERREASRLVLTRHDEYIGLRGEIADPRPREEEPAQAAARLVAHLNTYPADVEAREQLAKIYADHYQRMDLAADQVEALIASPGAGQKDRVRWLNMLVDFHVQIDQDRAACAAALQRVIELAPKSAAAEQAQTRRAYIETEMRKNKKSQALKLGSYDENIGLKGQLPRPPS